MTSVTVSLSILILALQGCGPAAEDRNVMHANAKRFQDSLANVIRMQMAEADPNATAIPRPDNPVTQQTLNQQPPR